MYEKDDTKRIKKGLSLLELFDHLVVLFRHISAMCRPPKWCRVESRRGSAVVSVEEPKVWKSWGGGQHLASWACQSCCQWLQFKYEKGWGCWCNPFLLLNRSPFPLPPINEAVRKVRFRQRNQTNTNWAQIKETLPLFVLTLWWCTIWYWQAATSSSGPAPKPASGEPKALLYQLLE